MLTCTLCRSKIIFFESYHKKKFYNCPQCEGILLDSSHYLSFSDEKKRYKLHNNNVEDVGYQQFVSPIVNEVLKRNTSYHKGLDFGSGTAPVITAMLRQHQYTISTYDPFFDLDETVLHQHFDYIVCCEVMEHFHNPIIEFEKLYQLSKPKGHLYCKTTLYQPTMDFNSWWYKNDPTHVFFYTKKTLEWIKNHFNFKNLEILEELIVFTK